MKARFWRLFPRGGALSACVVACAWLSSGAVPAWADQVSVDSRLRFQGTGTNAALFWQLPVECATNLVLQSAPAPSGPWVTIEDAAQPFVPTDPATQPFFRTELRLPVNGPQPAQIAQTIRTLAFSSKTNLNPATGFDIRIEPLRELWEALGLQLLVVRELVDGQEFSRFFCILGGQTVTGLGENFGGYGLMSGLVKDQTLYFTYSFGSGVHRSNVGKLQIVGGVVKLWDTGGFLNQDLFLRRTNAQITVETGTFQSFNDWLPNGAFGWIDESDPAATKLMARDGSVLATFLPVSP